MARRRRRSQGMTGFYGFPSSRSLQHQAASLANASLPSVRTITTPYQRSIRDVGGYTQAGVDLVKALGPDVADAYQKAIDQQRSIDAAAQQRLGETPGYGPDLAASQGAVGDSALSSLLSQSAAAQAYQAQQPGIVSSRGRLAQLGLQQALQDALQQRQDAFRSQFAQAYQQVRGQAFNESMALANYDQSNQQFAANQQLQRDQMAQQQAQFNAEQKRLWAQFLGSTSASGGKGKWTASQLSNFRDDAATTIEQAQSGLRNPNYDPAAPRELPNGHRNPASVEWQIPPNTGYGKHGGASVEDIYKHMTAHGIPHFVALDSIRRTYSPGVFWLFLSQNFPQLARRMQRAENPALFSGKPG